MMENYTDVLPFQDKSAVKMEGRDLSSTYSRRPPCATATRLILHERPSVQGDSKKGGLQEKLIINQSWKYKWKLDTTTHMVKQWTNQLIASAQMEQLGLLPRTTGIQLRLNGGICWYQVRLTGYYNFLEAHVAS